MDVKGYVDSLRIGSLYRATGRIAVAGVFTEGRNFPAYFLSQALERGLGLTDTGRADSVVAENKTDKDTFVIRGECLDGKAQKRMVVAHDFIRQGSTKNLQVRCVERGYPTREGTAFSYAGVAPSSVRYLNQQGDVWHSVDETLHSTGTRSSTSSLLDTGKSQDVKRIYEELKSASDMYDGCIGFVAVMGEGNERYSADLFVNQEAARLFMDSLLRSTAIESMKYRGSPQTTEGDIRGFLFSLETQWTPIRTEGNASILDINGSVVKGHALVLNDYPVHVGFINTRKPSGGSSEPVTEEVGSSKEVMSSVRKETVSVGV